MSQPNKAIEFIEKSGVKITGKKANKVVQQALIIAFEEGRANKANTFDPITYEKFCAKMKPRLMQTGLIKTGDAWDIAKGVTGYGSICNMMRYTMQELEDKGLASKIRNGSWVIHSLTQNKKT